MWPAILAWGGTDLVSLRDRNLRDAELAWRKGQAKRNITAATEAVSANGDRAFLQYVHLLAKSGRVDDARTLIRTKFEADLKHRNGQSSAVVHAVAAAGIEAHVSNFDAALSLLSEADRRVSAPAADRVNIDINRAAYLAELGRYQEALDAIDKAQVEFGAPMQARQTQINGSGREFAWIRACAFHGLGREAESKALLGAIEAVPNELQDPFFAIKTTDAILQRAYLCVGDTDAILTHFLHDLDDRPFAEAFALFPERRLESANAAAVAARVRADPRFRKAYAARYRDLPAVLLAAAHQWR